MALTVMTENGLNLALEVTQEGDVRLLHFSAMPFDEAAVPREARGRFRLVEIQAAGENPDDHHAGKHIGTCPGSRLHFLEMRDMRNERGRKVEVVQSDGALRVESHFQFYDGIPAARVWTEVENDGEEELCLEYLSTFMLAGLTKEALSPWDEACRLHVCHSTWTREVQWQRDAPPQWGLCRTETNDPFQDFSMKRICLGVSGTWGANEYLPLGCVENVEAGSFLAWQIEHHASWHAEVSDVAGQLYLLLSGPTEAENHWSKVLRPGKRFVSVPAAVACGDSFDGVMLALTRYRRVLRRQNRDNEALPVIFNDYMNCLNGDPTEEKLRPLIGAAAQAGCEIFCIDAGWYADGPWWDGVGEWLPSRARFPGGLRAVLDDIRAHGMIPGLWLEIEVMGIRCPLAKTLPDDWFFVRHGRRVIDHGRYQLDFRNPAVRAHAERIIDRLVNEYGVGYIKMDYNIDAGAGTELRADSFGDGLLEHTRWYLRWLEEIFKKYPELVIENCGSGGLRMTYSLLALHSIQSTSDQTDYRRYASIASACPSAVTPEQAAVWSYPLAGGDEEETAMNMVNALLLRVHQSGHLANLSPARFELVREGIALYKSIRSQLRQALPFWPLGPATFSSPWAALGMKVGENRRFLAVWRLEGERPVVTLPLTELKGRQVRVRCLYPSAMPCQARFHPAAGTLSVRLEQRNTARLFLLEG